MRKPFPLLIIVAVLASAFLFNVDQASAAARPTLVDTHFVSGKGIVFVFDTNGVSPKGPNIQNATLSLHGISYPMACTFNEDAGRIVCIVRGGLTEFAGDPGFVLLLGHWYSVTIPSLPEIPQRPDQCTECD